MDQNLHALFDTNLFICLVSCGPQL